MTETYAPVRCESFLRGPFLIARWEPRLGEGPDEARLRHPRRYTVHLLWQFDWASPAGAAPLRIRDVVRDVLPSRLKALAR
jgi:hypothetical protein